MSNTIKLNIELINTDEYVVSVDYPKVLWAWLDIGTIATVKAEDFGHHMNDLVDQINWALSGYRDEAESEAESETETWELFVSIEANNSTIKMIVQKIMTIYGIFDILTIFGKSISI